MALRLIPFLVNQPFDDPGLLVRFSNRKNFFLFDLGDISSLQVRQILKITHIFITHTHIDHFFGFDKVLRICLGHNKTLHLYGPPGLFKNIEGKLAGYSWNLIKNYKQNLKLYIIEVHKNCKIERNYQSKNKFLPSQTKITATKNGIILLEDMLTVTAQTLDHGIPCLGFSLTTIPQIKILTDSIKSIKLIPGPWIKYLKRCLYNKLDKKTILEVTNENYETTSMSLENLEKITYKLPMEKVTYITDVGYTHNNKKSIIKLAHKSTHLFIEAVFTSKHADIAASKHHLTSKQAGEIANISKSQKYTLFHHSPRYLTNPNRLRLEAKAAFNKTYEK